MHWVFVMGMKLLQSEYAQMAYLDGIGRSARVAGMWADLIRLICTEIHGGTINKRRSA